MSQKRKAQSYSYSLKQKIILNYEEGMSNKQICEKFQINHSTVSSIIKDKENIMSVTGNLKKKKRIKPPMHPDLENDLVDYLSKCRNSNVPVSGKLIQESAKSFAEQKRMFVYFCKVFSVNNGNFLQKFRILRQATSGFQTS